MLSHIGDEDGIQSPQWLLHMESWMNSTLLQAKTGLNDYIKQMEYYFLANGITSADKQ